jgi:hypothetical protein
MYTELQPSFEVGQLSQQLPKGTERSHKTPEFGYLFSGLKLISRSFKRCCRVLTASFRLLTKKFDILGASASLAMHATYPMHLYIYDLVILTTLHKEWKPSPHILHSISKSSFFHFYTIFGIYFLHNMIA